MDPDSDPGGLKTCGSGLGAGSAALLSRMSDLREELEEGGGEGEVHQAAVLQGLGQEDAQAPEQAGHAPTQRRILRQRCRK